MVIISSYPASPRRITVLVNFQVILLIFSAETSSNRDIFFKEDATKKFFPTSKISAQEIRHQFFLIWSNLTIMAYIMGLGNQSESWKIIILSLKFTNALILPYFDYCSPVWDCMSGYLSDKLQKLQNRAARVITKLPFDTSSNLLLVKLKWEKLSLRRKKQKALIMYKTLNEIAPEYLQCLFTQRHVDDYNLRNLEGKLSLSKPNTNYLKRSFCYNGACLNPILTAYSLPYRIRLTYGKIPLLSALATTTTTHKLANNTNTKRLQHDSLFSLTISQIQP